ncbi:hypothetical protein KO488_04645 [Poseidonibacter lekithochrous]|uniref:hypothetical protein n=1 Tax=Poseidonibacter TaxID=2321187 RepID=UPI001C08D896|nr:MULTISPECIES: hypothetical protein [Poseidonibacter]MBU3014035.1 hypothetical protein [Poseidonibacter lekithochrous]MDO6827331.1 hypothetical protein [Poseidonibacter sp. 1_MG-2023]
MTIKTDKIKDFNSIFWKIWGVNNRVYEPLDVFKIKRDKQRESKKHDNFLNDDKKLSNEEYQYHLNREAYNFYDLFTIHLLNNTKQVNFYVHQLNNINDNYRLFEKLQFKKDQFINLFSFQIAFIIENMNYNYIDISMFDNALKDNSLIPFFDKYREIRDYNNEIKKISQKDLATQLSHVNHDLKEIFEKSEIFIEDVTAEKFESDLSKWKKNKELPTFTKMLVIINTIHKVSNEEKIGKLFQLLIIRALLHIQKEFDISESIKLELIESVNKFREDIKRNYSINKEAKIYEEQLKYLIDMPDESKELTFKESLLHLESKLHEFLKHNNSDKLINIKMIDRELIINKFNKCKTKKDYRVLLSEIIDIPENNAFSFLINNSYAFMRFIISVKVEDKILFNRQFKYLDRAFGTLLSKGTSDNTLIEFINLLKEETDFLKCIDIVGDYFKKCQV